MYCDNAKRLLKIHKTKKIHIKEFTKPDNFEIKSGRFNLATVPTLEYCIVEIHPNGITPKYQEYVSAEISKLPTQDKRVKWYDNFELHIFLTVVDINGDERCRQSFAQQNIDLPFCIPRFLERSFLVNLADEFLPEDTLTIQCELIAIYYSESTELEFADNISVSSDELRENIEESSDQNSDNSNKQRQKRLSLELFKVVLSVLCLQGSFLALGIKPSFMQKMKDILPIYDEKDEIRQTFFNSLEIFQKYLALKEKLRNILNHNESIVLKVLNILFKVDAKYSKQTDVMPENTNNAEMRMQGSYEDEIVSNSYSEEADFYSENLSDSEIETEVHEMDWMLLQNLEVSLDVVDVNEAFESAIKEVSQYLDCYEKWKKKLLEEFRIKKTGIQSKVRYEKWKKKLLEFRIKKTEIQSKRISKDNGNDDYKFFLHDKDKENITETNHPGDCSMALEICANIKELLQIFLEMNFLCHKICKEDERLAEIDKFFDLKKPHQFSETNYESDSADNQNKWNFYIETVDGVKFIIPFDVDKITLGSKLISNSVIFERMLENPMREKNEKRVKLNDTDCGTFINFLQFLQTKEMKAESFAELCKCYEFADQYDVPEMMSLCVELMPSFLSLSNSDEIEELAYLHVDKHLTELVETFTEEGPRYLSGLLERQETCLDGKSSTIIGETKDEESNFEFYQ